MDRKNFIKLLALSSAGVIAGSELAFASISETPEIAITIDDFNISGCSLMNGSEINTAMLKAFERHSNLKAALFVTGKFINEKNTLPLLKAWNDNGHIICNHTYSHNFYPDTDFKSFSDDIIKNEEVLSSFTQFRKYFRFPYLKEGKTAEQRDNIRDFLKKHKYEMGYVTVDASDWYVDSRLKKRIKENPDADLSGYKDFYIKHIFDRANYYNTLSKYVLGRSVKHTLLIHHSVLNGFFLDDLLTMFTEKGWKLIDAESAFKDDVFKMRPLTLPAGESIIWSLAKESGKFEDTLRYPAEDEIYEKPLMDELGL